MLEEELGVMRQPNGALGNRSTIGLGWVFYPNKILRATGCGFPLLTVNRFRSPI
jgi:hypothetical protein